MEIIPGSFLNLQLYLKYPSHKYRYNVIEEMIIDRLKLYSKLNELENMEISVGNEPNLNGNRLEWLMKPPLVINRDILMKVLQIDHISHKMLQMAYSEKYERIKVFVNFETIWLKLRLNYLIYDQKIEFLKRHHINPPEIVTISEKLMINQTLKRQNALDPTSNYHKIAFSECNSLVNVSNVISKGMIYFHESEIDRWILDHVSKQWYDTATKLFKIQSSRTNEFLKGFLSPFNLVLPRSYSSKHDKHEITSENIDEFVEKMPFCMRTLHDDLRTNHHLKHFGRMQLSLFYKGLGLSVQESLKLWGDEFELSSHGRFRKKKCLYLVEYNYGLQGCRIDAAPFTCKQIIDNGLQHGCPFKHWNDHGIGEKLIQYKIRNVQNVLKLREEKKFTQACGACFEESFGFCSSEPIHHPNQYFDEAMAIKKQIPDIEDLFGD